MLIDCSECGKEISDKATSCPHCGCPVGFTLKKIEEERLKEESEIAKWKSHVPPPKPSTGKVLVWFVGPLLALILLAVFVFPNIGENTFPNRRKTPVTVAKNSVRDSAAIKAEEDARKRKEWGDKITIKDNLNRLSERIDRTKFAPTAESVSSELSFFQSATKDIYSAEGYTYQYTRSSEIDHLITETKSKLSKLQYRDLPLMRKAFGKTMNNDLWVDDISVSVFGERNTIIQFTSAQFASNRNIKQAADLLMPTARKYRFKQIRFKWYKGDSEYTYYDIDPPKDNEIAR